MLLLFYFIVLYLLYGRKLSIFTVLIVIQITSLLIVILLGGGEEISTIKRIYNILYTIIILTIIIYPWRYFSNIRYVYIKNKKYNTILDVIKYILFPIFIILIIVSFYVSNNITNINIYKYQGGADEFFYTSLPFSVRYYILATLLYVLGYFFIPLHFYYLQNKQLPQSLLSLVLSFSVLFYGITIFSRWTITHYVMLYAVYFILFRNYMPLYYKYFIVAASVVLFVIISLVFINITNKRFEYDDIHTQIYIERNIPLESTLQNPALYSLLSYKSQWYDNGIYVLDKYNYRTMKGQASFAPILVYIGRYTPIKWSRDDLINTRSNMMGEKYDNFIGLVANMVYDFGYLLSLLLAIMYNRITFYIRPKRGIISINNLLLSVLIVQIPLFAIFYSFIGGIIIALIFWLIIEIIYRLN